MRIFLAILLVCFAASAGAQQRPLARFVVPNAPAEVNQALERVLESRRRFTVTELETDREDEERLLRRLQELALPALATEGYFAARIRVETVPDDSARYQLRVELGPRATVRQVDLVFKGPIEQQPQRVADIRRAWELQAGAPFRDSVWGNAKSRLLSRVQEKDFAAAAITDSQAEVDVEQATVAVRVEVESGPAFTVGDLVVNNLKRYDKSLVERYNPFRPGDRYDVLQLLDFQRRMQSSPYFASVVVSVEPDPAKAERAPLVVDVNEATSKRVSFGLGYSTNTGPRVETTYRQAQLFGHPYTLLSGIGVDQKRAIIYGEVQLPPKPNGALDSVGALFERSEIDPFVTHRWGGGVARKRVREGPDSTIETRLGANVERETRRSTDPNIPGKTNDTLYSTYTWTRRAVDEITDPRRGDVMSGTVGAGVGREVLDSLSLDSLSNNTFSYLYGRYVRYQPVPFMDPRANILIGRIEAGRTFTDNADIVPKDFLFNAGGSGSVRGYSYQSLGPRAGTPRPGGTNLLVGSLEYVHWFNAEWGSAVFVDVGAAADNAEEFEFGRGAGLGARWKTIAGPIALDYAYGQRRSDGTGGRWRLHFSIAIAF